MQCERQTKCRGMEHLIDILTCEYYFVVVGHLLKLVEFSDLDNVHHAKAEGSSIISDSVTSHISFAIGNYDCEISGFTLLCSPLM